MWNLHKAAYSVNIRNQFVFVNKEPDGLDNHKWAYSFSVIYLYHFGEEKGELFSKNKLEPQKTKLLGGG